MKGSARKNNDRDCVKERVGQKKRNKRKLKREREKSRYP